MEVIYQPYIDPEYDSLIERIYPASVCIDNETYKGCTLVKIDSANRNGILLEMVQVLTDLDLVISKSYISTDGGWFMDLFHVTDQMGNKLTDHSLMLYIQQALCATRRGTLSKEIQLSPSSQFPSRHLHMPSDHTAIEVTTMDYPGLLSEISAVLTEQACHVADGAAWTHDTRAACILYIEDNYRAGPITDPARLAQIEELLENVVEAHYGDGERRSVRLAVPVAGPTHTERRLHQLMFADGDYEMCCSDCQCCSSDCAAPHVSIESWKEKRYSVVNVQSRDRPKLLFDTVCTLTDMQYVVFHAAIRSEGSVAKQEYFIRYKNGCTLDSDKEKEKLTRCLLASIERRVSHGLRLDVSMKDRPRLLSDVTRILRENGLTITRADLTTREERAMGSFYVAGMSGHEMDLADTIESVRKEIGGSVWFVNGSNDKRNWPWRTTLQVLMPWVSGINFKVGMCRFSSTAHVFALAQDIGPGTVLSPRLIDYKMEEMDEQNLQRSMEKLLRILATVGAHEISNHHSDRKTVYMKVVSSHEFKKFMKESSRQLWDLLMPICLMHQMGIGTKSSAISPVDIEKYSMS